MSAHSLFCDSRDPLIKGRSCNCARGGGSPDPVSANADRCEICAVCGNTRWRHPDQSVFVPDVPSTDRIVQWTAELAEAWRALGTTAEDAADDPDTATLADSIRVSLQYERDQMAQAREQLKAELAAHERTKANTEKSIAAHAHEIERINGDLTHARAERDDARHTRNALIDELAAERAAHEHTKTDLDAVRKYLSENPSSLGAQLERAKADLANLDALDKHPVKKI